MCVWWGEAEYFPEENSIFKILFRWEQLPNGKSMTGQHFQVLLVASSFVSLAPEEQKGKL